MEYVTGIYALNIKGINKTPGDWHSKSVRWDNLKLSDTNDSVFGDYGIYDGEVPMHDGKYKIANHVRACLDLIESGNYGYAEGMKEYYLAFADKGTTAFIFNQVLMLEQKKGNVSEIDRFMGKEYGLKWIKFKECNNYGT